jgi:hypothetical protein
MSAIDVRRRRLDKVLALSLVVLAGILRGVALGIGSGHLAEDRDDYVVVAKQYVAHGFWRPFDGVPNSFRPPLYPLLLAEMLKAGGGSAALGLLQLALGLGTVALTYHVGRKLGLGTLSVVAGGLVALDPLLIEYTTFPMTETLFTFLVVLLVAVAAPANDGRTGRTAEVRAAANRKRSQSISRWPTGLRAAVVGAVFGACTLCRPTIWPVSGLAALWLLWRSHRTGGRVRDLLVPAAAATIAAAVVISPWMLRNWKILGSPIMTTTHGGYTLLLGNNEEFFHQVAARPLAAAWRDSQLDRFQRSWFRNLVSDMDRQIGPGAGEIAQDRWMYHRAEHAIATEPRLFLRACVLRFAEFWNVVPLPPSRSTVSSVVVWGMCTGYSIELTLFVVGLGSLLLRWDDRWTFLVLLVLNFTVVHLFYWSNMRMRAPLVPLIALIAARAIAYWRDRRNLNIYVAIRPGTYGA